MIVTKDFPNKEFSNKEELFKAIRENKKSLKAAKMLATKEADSFSYEFALEETNRAKSISEDAKEITVKFVVNSCGWYDSHGDVHLEGCWNKTAKNNKRFIHLQEHKVLFDNVISYNSTPSVEKISIKGVKVDALIATSIIEKIENPRMFERYRKGIVKEHSVGMQYIWDKLYLCVDSNNETDVEEKANYDKYIDQVINIKEVEERGYFWGVGESKAIEASAVVLASNPQTGVLSVEENKSIEPLESTQERKPSSDTSKNIVKFSINQFN